MKIYSRIIIIALFFSGSLLFGEDLILDKESFEDGLFTCKVSENFDFTIGDLVDVYEDREEVEFRVVMKNYIDSLVVVEVGEDSIKLEPLWNGAVKNLKTGYYLISAGRNIETVTPDIAVINEETTNMVSGNLKPNFSLSIDTGVGYTFSTGVAFSYGTAVNFGKSSISFGGITSLDLVNTYSATTILDLIYTYNFPLGKNFEIFFGGGFGFRLDNQTYYNSYSSPEVLDVLGVAAEFGIKWINKSSFDLGLAVNFYGFVGTGSEVFDTSVFIGTTVNFHYIKIN